MRGMMSRFFYTSFSYNILMLYGLFRWISLRVINMLSMGNTP
ncbi:putative membrane protein [Escherichia coli 2-005-03_S4_C3]|nr:putative membrane protein [Escherichia coli 2-005-03_S4_C3]